jgi:hypothetical protein
MVQGPLLLREACIRQREQRCQVGRRCIEVVRQFDICGGFRELEWLLQSIELDGFVDGSHHLKELNR